METTKRLIPIQFGLLLPCFLVFFTCSGNKEVGLSWESALQNAQSQNKTLLVVFGADWCPDCQALRLLMKTQRIQDLLQEKSILLSVDVGEFDKNLDLDSQLGNPTKQGIPALVIVDPKPPWRILVSTKGGEFSNARNMEEGQVYEFLKKYL